MNSDKHIFSFVEVIVVIVVIGILFVLAIPYYGPGFKHDPMTKAMSDARHIGLAIKMFALDHDGLYPAWTDAKARTPKKTSALPNSNDVLATLIPDYITDEKFFEIKGSRWLKPNKSDGTISSGKKLKAGENAWAYVAGFTDESESRWPLLAPAFSQVKGNLGINGNPSYTNDENLKGGLWKGRKGIMLRCDGSAQIEDTHEINANIFIIGRDGDPTKNAFNYDAEANWLTPDCAVLQPIPPTP